MAIPEGIFANVTAIADASKLAGAYNLDEGRSDGRRAGQGDPLRRGRADHRRFARDSFLRRGVRGCQLAGVRDVTVALAKTPSDIYMAMIMMRSGW